MTQQQRLSLDWLAVRGFDNSREVGRLHTQPGCTQCEALCINGIATHEAGCPNATHECSGCWSQVPVRVKYCEGCI